MRVRKFSRSSTSLKCALALAPPPSPGGFCAATASTATAAICSNEAKLQPGCSRCSGNLQRIARVPSTPALSLACARALAANFPFSLEPVSKWTDLHTHVKPTLDRVITLTIRAKPRPPRGGREGLFSFGRKVWHARFDDYDSRSRLGFFGGPNFFHRPLGKWTWNWKRRPALCVCHKLSQRFS